MTLHMHTILKPGTRYVFQWGDAEWIGTHVVTRGNDAQYPTFHTGAELVGVSQDAVIGELPNA